MNELQAPALEPENAYRDAAVTKGETAVDDNKLGFVTPQLPRENSGEEDSYILWGDVLIGARL